MIIRQARREDIADIVAIYCSDPISGPRENGADLEVYFRAFERMETNPSQMLLVAEEDSKIAGTLQVTLVDHLLRQGARRAILEAMFVHSSFQGKGVGAALVQAARDEAVRAGCITLELTSNKARVDAHRFYERLGFKASHEGFKLTL